jgi:hypothetical protein
MDLITSDHTRYPQMEHMNLIRDRDIILKTLKSKMTNYATLSGKPLNSEPFWENHIKYDVLSIPHNHIVEIEYRVRQTRDNIPFGYMTSGSYLAWLE